MRKHHRPDSRYCGKQFLPWIAKPIKKHWWRKFEAWAKSGTEKLGEMATIESFNAGLEELLQDPNSAEILRELAWRLIRGK